MTTPTPPPPHLTAALEDGQILVLTVVVALALLAILGLGADGGLVLARHRELQGVADAAARVGAAQLDEASYRASNGRTALLNPAGSHGGRAVPADGPIQRAGQHRCQPNSSHDRAI